MPSITIVGGGHGAGKTTYCRALVAERECMYLTNQEIRRTHGADLERGEVHRLLEQAARACFAARQSFVFEHIMSGTFTDKLLHLAAEHKFDVELVYLDIIDAHRSMTRVSQRIAAGGHDVDRDKIARRLSEGRAQFWNDYRLRARRWLLLDTSGPSPVEIAYGAGHNIVVADRAAFEQFTLRAERTDGLVMN